MAVPSDKIKAQVEKTKKLAFDHAVKVWEEAAKKLAEGNAKVLQTRLGEAKIGKQRKTAELFAKFHEAAKDMTDKSMYGYDSWLAAMLSLVPLHKKFVEAMQSYSLIGGLIQGAIEKSQVKDAAKPKPVNPGSIIPATIIHDIKMKDDNTLDLSSLRANLFFDNEPLTKIAGGDAAEECLKAGVVGWLDDLGYAPEAGKPANTFWKDGTQLTRGKFNDLLQSPVQGFDQFVQKKWGIAVEQKHTVEDHHTPTPKPR